MSNFMNYDNASDIFEEVKDYIDSHGGPRTVVWTSATIEVEGWDNGEYSFENRYPHIRYDICGIVTAENATDEQRASWRDADCGGYESDNVIVAHGVVPEIDIPVMLGIVDKMSAPSGNGPHVIEDEEGTDLTPRPTLQFGAGFTSEDDSTNEKTIVQLDTASDSTLGGIKIGAGLEIDENGVVDVISKSSAPVVDESTETLIFS